MSQPPDPASRYYDALEACNLGRSKDDFHRLVAEQVLASAKRLLELVG